MAENRQVTEKVRYTLTVDFAVDGPLAPLDWQQSNALLLGLGLWLGVSQVTILRSSLLGGNTFPGPGRTEGGD